MSIQDTVDSLITNANDWATSARDTANDAIQSLADVDFPYPSEMSFSFDALVPINPDTPAQPSSLTIDAAPAIAALGQVDVPDKPDKETVTLGDLLSITLPDVPVVEFPSLNITAPSYTITAPSTWSFSINDILITDDPMVQAALTRLTSNIENGGTGLSQDAEDAIWNRDRERAEQQLSDSTDKVISMWAKKGFSLPDGFLAHSLSEIQKEYLNKNLDRSRDITIKQADLEQNNLFKSLELAVSLSSHLIGMLLRYEEIGLRANEDTAKFANEYIDLQIKTYNSLLEAYRIKAQVLETQVRASLAKVEVYRSQLEGQKIILGINDQTVKVYVEQLRATTILIDRYKTEVEAMVALLGVEKAKIESNKLQMDAWAKKADVAISKFSGEVELFKSVGQQNISIADLQGRQGESTLRANLAASELAMKSLEVSERSAQAYAALKVDAAKGVAQAAATLAAGAMAGVTTSASEQYQENKDLTTE